MIYSKLTKDAFLFCEKAHAGQFDKGGFPYIFHPFHLAEQMPDEVSVAVALLHDVPEDSDISIQDLEKFGFPDSVIAPLKKLTHDNSVPYLEYIWKLRNDDIARKVKIADLKHNGDLSRIRNVTGKDYDRKMKYDISLAILSSAQDTVSGQTVISIPIYYDNEMFTAYYFKNEELKCIEIWLENRSKKHLWLSPSNISTLCEELKTDPISLPLMLFNKAKEITPKGLFELIMSITKCEPQVLGLISENELEKQIKISDYYKF